MGIIRSFIANLAGGGKATAGTVYNKVATTVSNFNTPIKGAAMPTVPFASPQQPNIPIYNQSAPPYVHETARLVGGAAGGVNGNMTQSDTSRN